MKKFFKTLVKIILISYVGFGILLYFFQKKFVYFPTEQNFNSCQYFQDSEKLNINGTRAYYKKNNSNKLFVFYHGNAGSACDRGYLRDYLDKTDLSYIIVEYAGYSNDVKKPSKELIMKDVENINEFISKQDFTKVIISGESLGTSLAVYHSTLTFVDKMLLISPFYSLNNIAKKNYGFYPISLLSTENFDSGMWMKSSKANEIKIIHGNLDEIVPIEESKRLFNEIKTVNKKFIEVSNAHHNDIYDFNETGANIQEFLK
jgi:esterase/lipase